MYLLEQNWQEIVAFGQVFFTLKEGESLEKLLPCNTCSCDLVVLEPHCGWHLGVLEVEENASSRLICGFGIEINISEEGDDWQCVDNPLVGSSVFLVLDVGDEGLWRMVGKHSSYLERLQVTSF